MSKRFLISGCAGDIAISISKVIKSIYSDAVLIGLDMSPKSHCELYFDETHESPAANSPGFREFLENTLKKTNPDYYVPTPEAELEVLASKNFEFLKDIKCLMPNSNSVNIGIDKLETSKFLEKNNLPFPWTIEGDQQPKALPCIYKIRQGSGSKNIQLVKNEKFVPLLREEGQSFIWQEYIDQDDLEFTCGLFRSSAGETRHIILKRKLSGGLTGSGEVVENESIAKLLDTIAEKIDLVGSINVQLRLDGSTPKVFEINPRFSSTVFFRHLLGFEDVKWSLEDLDGGAISSYSANSAGKRIFRASKEVIY